MNIFEVLLKKFAENAASFQNVKGTNVTKINSTLLFSITIIFNARNAHYTLQHFTLWEYTASSN